MSLRIYLILIASLLITWLPPGSEAVAGEPQVFSPAQLHVDLAELSAALQRIHPDVEHSVRRADLARALADARGRLDRPMTRDSAWTVMSTLNPVMADGHMAVLFPGGTAGELRRHLEQGGRLFPFEVQVAADGELFVRAALGGEPAALQGVRIEAIDGVPARQVSERLLAHVNGDTPALRAALLSLRFPFYYWKLFGDKPSYRLRVGGIDTTFEGRAHMPAAYADPSFEQAFRFEIPDARRAVLTINSFYWGDKARFREFTSSAFARMRAAGTQTLIIDIRANAGGDDDMWIEGLMPYLATRPFRNGSDYVLKIIAGRQKEGQKVGEVVRGSQSTWYPAADEALRFKGKVYVLIGPATYSSAILFATAVQDNGFGTIVGTGGASRGTQSGGIQNVKLRHTGIEVVVPRFLLKRTSGVEGLLQPDILLPEDPFRAETAIEALLRSDGVRQGADATTERISSTDGSSLSTRGALAPS